MWNSIFLFQKNIQLHTHMFASGFHFYVIFLNFALIFEDLSIKWEIHGELTKLSICGPQQWSFAIFWLAKWWLIRIGDLDSGWEHLILMGGCGCLQWWITIFHQIDYAKLVVFSCQPWTLESKKINYYL